MANDDYVEKQKYLSGSRIHTWTNIFQFESLNAYFKKSKDHYRKSVSFTLNSIGACMA